MPPAVMLDHLAVAVHKWTDAYERFIGELGGRWARGGPADDHAPFQLHYGDCLQLEFLEPRGTNGFVQRYVDRGGPAPHHLMFKVASRDAVFDAFHDRGFETFRGRPDRADFREGFVHPKVSGLGTLVQVQQMDQARLDRSFGRGRPDDLPESTVDPRTVALIGLTVGDRPRIRELLVGALRGFLDEEGPGWDRVSWGPGRSLLIREASATPGDARLWGESRPEGVAFVLFGPTDLTVAALEAAPERLNRLPPQVQTGLSVWLC